MSKEGLHYLLQLGLNTGDANSYELFYWKHWPGLEDNDDAAMYVWEFDEYYYIKWDDLWEAHRVDVLVRKSDLKMWGKGARKANTDLLNFIADLRAGRNIR